MLPKVIIWAPDYYKNNKTDYLSRKMQLERDVLTNEWEKKYEMKHKNEQIKRHMK